MVEWIFVNVEIFAVHCNKNYTNLGNVIPLCLLISKYYRFRSENKPVPKIIRLFILGSLIDWPSSCLLHRMAHCQKLLTPSCLPWSLTVDLLSSLPGWSRTKLTANMAVCLPSYRPAYVATHQDACLSTSLLVSQPECLPICLTTCLSACLPSCLSITASTSIAVWQIEVMATELSSYEPRVLTTQQRVSLQWSHLLLILYLSCLIFLQKDSAGFLAVSYFVTYTW